MNRRDFLSRFAQTVAGAAIVHTLDVDKLLWVAGERTIFIPPVTLHSPNYGQIVAEAWESVIGSMPLNNIFNSRALLYALRDDWFAEISGER